MVRKTIMVIGTVNYDTSMIVERVPDAGESLKASDYKQSTGGKGANVSISTFRSCHNRVASDAAPSNGPQQFSSAYQDGMDIEVRLVAKIGDDANGRICRSNLEDNGIEISGLREMPGSMTGMSVCVVEKDTGQNRIMSHRGANDMHRPDEYRTLDQFTNAPVPDLLISHFALPVEVVEQILETAGRAKIDIVFNCAPGQRFQKKLYKYVTHLIVNETEAAILSGKGAHEITVETCPDVSTAFLKGGAKNVVITLGAQGAFFARFDESHKLITGHVPAHECEVVDTTGAGDTFVGTYASEYVHQKSENMWDIKKAVERACAASTYTIGAVGAQAAIPWAEQIQKVLSGPPLEPDLGETPSLQENATTNPPVENIHSVDDKINIAVAEINNTSHT